MSVKTMLSIVSGLLAWAMSSAALAAWEVNMPVGVTEISREVFGLHMLIFWVCVAIGVVVFGVMFYSVFAHRKSRHPKPADFHESTLVEIIWTTLPFVILIAMAIPAAGTLIKMEDTRGTEMTVKITGYQWKWQYEYLEHDISFFSSLSADSNEARRLGSGIDPATVDNYLLDVDNRLVLPVDTKVRFLLTSNDVIHAWWIPDFAVKKDAVPGYINEMWTKVDVPGVYRGQCAELCGRDHGFMPIVVEVLSKEDFAAWVAEQTGGEVPAVVAAAPAEVATDAAPDAAAEEPAVTAPAEASMADLMAAGEKVYNTYCGACHQKNGEGMPPAFPALKGSPVATGDLATHIDIVINGKNAMTPFGASLSDEQIAAVITYERNAWGNDTGDVVQPAQIAAAP